MTALFLLICELIYDYCLWPLHRLETFLAAVLFLSDPSLANFVLCAIIGAAQHSQRMISTMLFTADQLETLREFVVRAVAFRFKISEVDISQYINREDIDAIGRFVPTRLAGTRPIARIFLLQPLTITQPLGAWKGFLVQMAPDVSYYSPTRPRGTKYEVIETMRLASLSPSYVFIDSKPSDLTDIGKFRLMHELGHCTEYSHRANTFKYHSGLGSFVLSVIVIFSYFDLTFFTSSLLLCCVFLSIVETLPKVRISKDEFIADWIAFLIFGRRHSLDKILGLHEKWLVREKNMHPLVKSKRLKQVRKIRANGLKSLKIIRFSALGLIRLAVYAVLYFSMTISINSHSLEWLFFLMIVVLSFISAHMTLRNCYLRELADDILAWLASLDYTDLIDKPYSYRKETALQSNPSLKIWFEEMPWWDKANHQADRFVEKETDRISRGLFEPRIPGLHFLSDYLANFAGGTLFAIGVALLSTIPFLHRSF